MSKPMTIRMDEIHLALLEKMVETLQEKGINTNKTDMIQKAIYSFARDTVLDADTVGEIIDQHYKGFPID